MRSLYQIVLSVFLISTVQISVGQTQVEKESQRLESLKKEGKLNYEKLSKTKQVLYSTGQRQYPVTNSINTPQALCNCEVPFDLSFAPVPFDGTGCSGTPGNPPDYRNDDGFTATPIALPFNFQFYGVTYNSVFINNNGNISFNTEFCTYSANGFPDATHAMIAPFWADVDTRAPGSGVVYYKLTSSALIVKWDMVGYYGQHDDLLNTFQLVITDGLDPLLPPGYNVSFCYREMEWTTGDASQGAGGFGGIPATVGINAGDGINFAQVGEFGIPGNSYAGVIGTSGIDFLDQQAFFFNTAIATGSSNIPPIVRGLTVCDTAVLCATDAVYSDTLPLSFSFLSPEIGQITTVTATGPPNFTVLSNIPGNIVNVEAQIVISSQSPGLNTITFIAVDDGVPPASDTIRITFKVDTFAFQPPSPITGSNFYCDDPNNNGVTLYMDTIYETYLWSDGTTGVDSLHVLTGTYNCEVTNINGCKTKSPPFPVWAITPYPVISGITAFCGTDSAHLETTEPFAHYQWLLGGVPTGDTSAVLHLGPTNSGIYSVLITDSIGCEATSAAVNVDLHPYPQARFNFSPSDALGGDTIYFYDVSTAGSGTINGWFWDFGDGANSTSTLQNPTHVYDSSGVYSVTLIVTQSDGCKNMYTRTYTVASDEIESSNVFTPNRDGINDFFEFKNLEYFPNSQLQVFNRWGKKIYENGNYDNKWDGGDAKEGVYYYILKIPEKETKKGTVTILRSAK